MLDNYGTHGHPKVKAWLANRPRFHLHFVPTGSSWLSLIEVWSSQLTNRAIRRGSFTAVGELVIAIHRYIDAHNADPKPFVWTASVEAILEKGQSLSSYFPNGALVDRLDPVSGFLARLARASMMKDKRAGEKVLRGSDLDWTIV